MAGKTGKLTSVRGAPKGFSTLDKKNRRLTRKDVHAAAKKYKNWGRWGKDDQKGTLNLITPAVRKQALALVREGTSVSLAHTVDKTPAPDSPQPIGQKMTLDNAGHAMDLYTIWYHSMWFVDQYKISTGFQAIANFVYLFFWILCVL